MVLTGAVRQREQKVHGRRNRKYTGGALPSSSSLEVSLQCQLLAKPNGIQWIQENRGLWILSLRPTGQYERVGLMLGNRNLRSGPPIGSVASSGTLPLHKGFRMGFHTEDTSSGRCLTTCNFPHTNEDVLYLTVS